MRVSVPETTVCGIHPRVFWRLTDNWLEMTVRFVCHEPGTRALKDAMARDILAGFDAAGIRVASSTFEVVGLPPLRVKRANGEGDLHPVESRPGTPSG